MLRIVWAIGWSDFFLKYRGSILGYFWSLLAPLMKFLVILYVFQPLVGPAIPQYPLYLFLGILIWEHFALTTSGCMAMLWDKASIIQKVPCPRIVFILAVGLTNAMIFLTHMLVFTAFALFLGAIHWTGYLALPLILLQMTMLALGVGMLLSSYALKYRDVQHIWDIALQVLFWLTPITYAYSVQGPILAEMTRMVMGGAQGRWMILKLFVLLQPLSVLTHDARRFLLYTQELGVPSVFHLTGFTLACAVVFASGYAVFLRRSRFFVEEY